MIVRGTRKGARTGPLFVPELPDLLTGIVAEPDALSAPVAAPLSMLELTPLARPPQAAINRANDCGDRRRRLREHISSTERTIAPKPAPGP